MRDPIDLLTTLEAPEHEPLPAAELRRRGDQRRRRRTAGVGVAAALLLAAAVTVPNLLADPVVPAGTPTSDPTTAPTPTADPTTPDGTDDQPDPAATPIPTDFPLARHLPTGPDYQQVDPAQAAGIEVCGHVLWPAAAAQSRAAMVVGPEHTELRWLGVLADADQAVALLADTRAALAGCATTGTGDALAVVPLTGGTGYDEVTVALVQADGSLGGEVVQLIRVGSAVLLSVSGGELTAESAQGTADLLTAQSADLAAAMCVVTAAGC